MAPARQSVADCAGGDAGDVHGHFGHFHRRGGAAVHRRQSGRDTGRIHLGADELSGGQRDHPAGQHLVLQLFRTQTVSDRLHRDFHRGFVALRSGDHHADAGRLPASCKAWAAAPCSRLSQAILLESFPPAKRGAATALFGLAIVVAPIRRSDSGRLADGQLVLALDFLHQSARGHPCVFSDVAGWWKTRLTFAPSRPGRIDGSALA